MMEENSGRREVGDNMRPMEEEDTLEETAKEKQRQRQFAIDPFSGIVRSRTKLMAKSCSLWRVRVSAFHLLDEWNLNGANGSDAFLRVRVAPASPSSASSAMPLGVSSSASSSSSSSFAPRANFDCVFLFPSDNSSSPSSALPSPFAIVRIDENEVPSSDSPIARVGVLSSEDHPLSVSSPLSSPVEFEMEEGPSQFLFRLDTWKGTVRMAKAMDRERDGQRHRLTIWGRIRGKMRTKMPCILEVVVNDANDNAPRFGHILSLSLNRSTPVGSVVFQVRSEDPDLAENARNWFSLSGEEAEQMFSIDKWTGEMTLIRKLAEEKKSTHRFGITVQDTKWRVHSTMTVQIVEDQNEHRTNANEMPTFSAFEFDAFAEGGDHERDDGQAEQQQQQQVIELGRVPGHCRANGGVMPTVGWAWTKHEGAETALMADLRLFKTLESDDGTAEREFVLFCADGIGHQKVRLHWRRRPSAAFPSDFPPIIVPNDPSAFVHSSTSLHLLLVLPLSSSNSSPIFLPPTLIPFLPIADRSETAQIGRVIVEEGEEESDQTDRKWHFELENQSTQSWIKVDKRNGIVTVNASAIPLSDDQCWKDDQKLIGVKVTDERGQRKGRTMFSLLSTWSTSFVSPKFTRRFWHFSVPRHSPHGTIVGQLQIDGIICDANRKWQIVMDANAEKAFQIDQSTGELTIRKKVEEEQTNLKRKKEVANGGDKEKEKEEEEEETNIVVALIGGGDQVIDRCFVRVFFSRRRPPCVVFPSPHYSVRLSSATPDQTVLLRFDMILHTDFKILLNDSPPLPFCFPSRSPSALSLCSALPPLPLSSPVSLLLLLFLVHPSGHICSRSSVSLLILPFPSFLPFVPPGSVGFVPRNAPAGQNVLQFMNGQGPLEIIDQQMAKLFRLNPSSGVLSTRIPLAGILPSSSVLPICVRSPNGTFHIFVLLEDKKRMNDNASSVTEDKMEVILPMVSFVKTANAKLEELSLLEATGNAHYPNQRRCVPTSKRMESSEMGQNVTITATCSLLLPRFTVSSLPSSIVPLGTNVSLRIDSLHLLRIFPCLVEFRLFSSAKMLGTLLSAIVLAVPDLAFLLPFVLSDHFSVPFGFHRLLVAFRDQNGNFLPQSEAVRLLQHFFDTFTNISANVWNLQIEQTSFRVEEEKGILDCLEGRRAVFGMAQRVWAPFKMDEDCVRLVTIFHSQCPPPPLPLSLPSAIALSNKFVPSPVLSFMPSANSLSDHFGFVRFSGILLPRLRLISLQFLTFQSSALLLYFSLGSPSSLLFLSVDLINGKPRLNVGLTFPLQSRLIEKSVNDGKWWYLALSWTKRRVSLALAECQKEDGNGEECAPMGHGVHRVHVQLQQELNLLLHPPSLHLSSFVILGDISAFSDLLHLHGRVSAFSFVGCQRRIAIDGFELTGHDLAILEEQLDQFKLEINATTSSVCPFIGGARDEWSKTCQRENAVMACRGGICLPEGHGSFICQCENQQIESVNCEQTLFAVSVRFHPLHFVLSPRTFSRLSFVPLPGNCVHSLPRPSSVRRRGEDEDAQFADGLNVLELDFHPLNGQTLNNGTGEALLCIQFEDLLLMIALEKSANSLHFFLQRQNNTKNNTRTQSTPFSFDFELVINSSTPVDGLWHRLAMGVSPDGTMLRLQLDDMEPAVHRSTLPNFFPLPLSSRLKSLSLGSPCGASPFAHQKMSAFRGCVRRFVINNQLQQLHPQMDPMPTHKRFLRLLIDGSQSAEDAKSHLCLSTKLAMHANFVSTFAVVFVLLLLLFLLLLTVFILFQRRRKSSNRKENGKGNKIAQKKNQRNTLPIIVPSLFEEEETYAKRDTLENWRGMAVSSDTFSSLGFSSFSTFPHPANINEPNEIDVKTT